MTYGFTKFVFRQKYSIRLVYSESVKKRERENERKRDNGHSNAGWKHTRILSKYKLEVDC